MRAMTLHAGQWSVDACRIVWTQCWWPRVRVRALRTPKRITTITETLGLEIPCDRHSKFAPPFVPKGLRRLLDFDQRVLALLVHSFDTRFAAVSAFR